MSSIESSFSSATAGGGTEGYRGRLAPSPTGYLHLGHARTFWTAFERCREHEGRLVLRNEDLDGERVRAEYVDAMYEDLRWLGIQWNEGPDLGGPFGPYTQSERLPLYRAAFEGLRRTGRVYPCTCSRKDILGALSAPHASDEEPVYPGTCLESPVDPDHSGRTSWRFRTTEGASITFSDGRLGQRRYTAGVEFGDFVVWRRDVRTGLDLPSYHLAVVVDDAAMAITEVVRGADLLVSTARQILLYRALDLVPPRFYHCDLMTDENGVRLAKRHDALSLGALRRRGFASEILTNGFRETPL